MINLAKILNQAAQIKVKSITDTLFKYGLIIFILMVVTAIFKTPEWVTVGSFIVACLVLGVGLFFYIYYSFKNPDYLRSETYQLKKQSIELLGDKNNVKNPHMDKIIYITSSPYSLDADETPNKLSE